MSRTAWLDASSGISGDMLLGALVDAGVPLVAIQQSIDALALPERLVLVAEEVMRSGLGATKVHIRSEPSRTHRRLPDVLDILEPLPPVVRDLAEAVFRTLATAEAAVHRVAPEDVHFHEVGAIDSIADVVGVITGVLWLELDELVCSSIALGGGRTGSEHGSIPVPSPAVVELLRRAGAPAQGGPVERELATPTGVALAVTLASRFGPMPAMVLDAAGIGAGTWDPPGHSNVIRLVYGTATHPSVSTIEREILMSANVDDLDPRLWPGVLAELMAAGAADAWLTPIVMKKGRPAHTVSVLIPPSGVDAIERVLVTSTSTIGMRRHEVAKVPFPREIVEVQVDGAPVRVKVARLDGQVVNASPEYDDIAALAARRELPEKQVLAAAIRAAGQLWTEESADKWRG